MQVTPKITFLPIVSVVIPCYNRSYVIERAVSSALSQTISNLEVIVVDDGSEDSEITKEIIYKIADSRVRFFAFETNQGGGAARNYGAERANGKFVAFLDSDDEWLPVKLERQLAIYSNEVSSTTKTLVFCKTEVHTGADTSQVWPAHPKPRNSSVGDYLFVSDGFLQTSSFLLPRDEFLNIRFNEDLKRHQDFDLALRLEDAGFDFVMVDEVLTILHWEDYHSTLRGFSAAVTKNFLQDYKTFLSASAEANFLYRHLVDRLFITGQRSEALEVCRTKEFCFLHLTIRNKVGLISQLCFGDKRILAWAVTLKKLTGRS